MIRCLFETKKLTRSLFKTQKLGVGCTLTMQTKIEEILNSVLETVSLETTLGLAGEDIILNALYVQTDIY